MTKKTALKWIPSVVTAIAFVGMASFCHAQSPIVLSNDSSQSTAFYDGGPAGATYTWQATGGPNGGGCIKGVIDGSTTLEFDPAWNVSFVSGQYYQATVQMMVDPGSGTTGNSGSGGYGNIQLSFRDASFSWNGVGYHTIFPPAANSWVTYTFSVPGPSFNVAHLQLQLQASAAYSGPVTIYIGNVTISPVPNPSVLAVFTNDTVTASWNSTTMSASYDTAIDAPYINPVNNSAPLSITPAGSVEFQANINPPSQYPGGQLNVGFNPSQFQTLGFDMYYDGPTPSNSTNYGGFQMFIADGNAPYNWHFIGSANFSAGMVGKWTHFNFPCASSGVVNAAGIAIQATPGGTPGTDPITFHLDNLQGWNPVFLPSITSMTKGTPGGVQITLDGNGANNIYDQEGISSPSTNNSSVNYFWINQTPATYAFTLTNFPSPASAPQFDAHIYIDNGDSIQAFNGAYNYNQTYSGSPYNMVDYLGLHVQNGTNGGVVATVDWKTNAPNSNATNMITFNYTSMPSANGTWLLKFSDNTHGSVIANDGSVSNFTLPDFSVDPNYTANFTPASSMVQFGVFKNGNTNNNDRAFTLVSLAVTNASTTLADNFSGPGLTANNNWQVAEYYQFAANRATWQPAGTAFWLKWNTTSGNWGVQSSSNIVDWASAGVTYTYPDSTGTNTLGAVPATNLPAGNMGLFRLVK